MSAKERLLECLNSRVNHEGETADAAPAGAGTTTGIANKLNQSIEAHDRQYHHGNYTGGKCSFREKVGAQANALGVKDLVKNVDQKATQTQGGAEGQNAENNGVDNGTETVGNGEGGVNGNGNAENATPPVNAEEFNHFADEYNKLMQDRHYSDLSEEEQEKVDALVDGYLDKALGEAEAGAVEELKEVAKNASLDELDEIKAVANDILNNPQSNDAQKVAAQSVLDACTIPETQKYYKASYVQIGNEILMMPPERMPGESDKEYAKTVEKYQNFAASLGNARFVTNLDYARGRYDDIIENATPGEKAAMDNIMHALGDLTKDDQRILKAEQIMEATKDDKLKLQLSDFEERYRNANGPKKAALAKELEEAEEAVTNGKFGYDPNIDAINSPVVENTEPMPVDILPVGDVKPIDTKEGEDAKALLEFDDDFKVLDAQVDKVENGKSRTTLTITAMDKNALMKAKSIAQKAFKAANYNIEVLPGNRGDMSFKIDVLHEGGDKTEMPSIGSLREAISSEDAKEKTKGMLAPFLIGTKMENGVAKPVFRDLSQGGGILAGEQRSGKTTRGIAGIAGMMCLRSPKDLQLMFSSPLAASSFDVFEDNIYNAGAIGKSWEQASANCDRALNEMARRKELCKKEGVSTVQELNKKLVARGEEPLPAFVNVVDEVKGIADVAKDGNGNEQEYAKNIMRVMGLLNQQGGKYGVGNFAMTQEMTKDSGMPAGVKGVTRMACKMSGVQDNRNVFGHNKGIRLSSLEPKKEIAYDDGGNVGAINGVYTSDKVDPNSEISIIDSYYRGKDVKTQTAQSANKPPEAPAEGTIGASTANGSPAPAQAQAHAGAQTQGQTAPKSYTIEDIKAMSPEQRAEFLNAIGGGAPAPTAGNGNAAPISEVAAGSADNGGGNNAEAKPDYTKPTNGMYTVSEDGKQLHFPNGKTADAKKAKNMIASMTADYNSPNTPDDDKAAIAEHFKNTFGFDIGNALNNSGRMTLRYGTL